MRMVLVGCCLMLVSRPLAGQGGPRSAVAQVTLTARKTAMVGVTPVTTAPLTMGRAAVPSSADDAVLAMHWNLPPSLVGSVLLRTSRGVRPGSAYIERRLLVAEPIATTTTALPRDHVPSSDPDAVLAVRLVLY